MTGTMEYKAFSIEISYYRKYPFVLATSLTVNNLKMKLCFMGVSVWRRIVAVCSTQWISFCIVLCRWQKNLLLSIAKENKGSHFGGPVSSKICSNQIRNHAIKCFSKILYRLNSVFCCYGGNPPRDETFSLILGYFWNICFDFLTIFKILC